MNNMVVFMKKVMMIILNIIAVLSLLAGYMPPVYEYRWSLDPGLANIVNSEAVLAITVLLLLSLVSATGAFFLKKTPKEHIIYFMP